MYKSTNSISHSMLARMSTMTCKLTQAKMAGAGLRAGRYHWRATCNAMLNTDVFAPLPKHAHKHSNELHCCLPTRAHTNTTTQACTHTHTPRTRTPHKPQTRPHLKRRNDARTHKTQIMLLQKKIKQSECCRNCMPYFPFTDPKACSPCSPPTPSQRAAPYSKQNSCK